MKQVTNKTINELLELSRLLGEFGNIKRATLLPNGEPEADSHHSFSLALIAFELASQYAPQLDTRKILLYSLVHDLPELISGDMPTLTATTKQLQEKARLDAQATEAFKKKMPFAPFIIKAIDDYEARRDEEARFVYWLDKMVTIPTHFYDNGINLRALGIKNRADIQGWYQRTLVKLGQPKAHQSAVDVLELAYKKMHDELLEEVS